MSENVHLPSGGWICVRAAGTVPVYLRRPVEKALIAVARGDAKAALDTEDAIPQLDPGVIDQFYELNDLLAVARIESWSFDYPISIDSLIRLEQADYEEILKWTAVDVALMVPNFGFDNDPTSPSKPSNV